MQLHVTFPNITIEDSYAISTEVAQRKIKAGAKLIGHKVGLTSKAMQRSSMIDEPDYGYILDDQMLSDGAKVIFGIRPEAVNDKESIDRNARSVATFDAKVEIVEPAGPDTYVVTRAAGKELTARMRAETPVRIGQNHTFALNLDKAVLFDPQTTRRI